MVWRVGAHVHSFLHGLFKPSEAAQVRALYEDLAAQFRHHALLEEGRAHLIADIAAHITDQFTIAADHAQAGIIHSLIQRLFDYEALFRLPEVDWSRQHSIAELWDVREALTLQRGWIEQYDAVRELLTGTVQLILHPLYTACPSLLATDDEDGITIETDLLHSIPALGDTTETMLHVAFIDELADDGLLSQLRDRLERSSLPPIWAAPPWLSCSISTSASPSPPRPASSIIISSRVRDMAKPRLCNI